MSTAVDIYKISDHDPRTKSALRFSAGIMLISLLFQRFGLIFGASILDAVVPLGMALIGLGVLTGILAFDRTRLILWLALLMWAVFGAAIHAAYPSPFGGALSLTSLGGFLVMNIFAVFRFAKPVDERAFFQTINACLGFIALAGVLQFVAQFGGLALFKFTGLLPSEILVEPFYNVANPISGSNYFKANGFFLLEPSIFSQFMALALLIEILVLRRLRFLLLFGTALMVSMSGTGELMILAFVLSAMASMGRRGIGLAIATVLGITTLLLAMYTLAPDIFAGLQSRLYEFQLPGTSGHMRFITPWWFAHDILSADPLAWIFGIGAGIAEHPTRYITYDYNVNPPVKLLLEYGLPALIMYILLLVSGRKSVIQRALLAPVLVLILLDGGYEQTPFILFPAMLICLVGNLKTDDRHVTHARLIAESPAL